MSTATPGMTLTSFAGAFGSMAADRIEMRRMAEVERREAVREQNAMARLAREIALLRAENESLRRRAASAEARAEKAVRGLLIATGRA